MKRFFTKAILALALFGLIGVSSASAQYRPKRMPKHKTTKTTKSKNEKSEKSKKSSRESISNEISLGVGLMTTGQVVNLFESVFDAMNDSENMNTNMAIFGPAFTVQYLYTLTDHISVGANVVYQQSTGVQAIVDNVSAEMGDTSMSGTPYVFAGKYITFMPTAKLYWFNKDHFAMYTRLSIGGTYRMENENGVSNNTFMFNGQLSPVCIEFGGLQFRGFLEEGLGANGSIFGGVKYSF